MFTNQEEVTQLVYEEIKHIIMDDKNETEILDEPCSEGDCDTKNHPMSLKMIHEFPIYLCRRGSKDFFIWLNGFTSGDKISNQIIDTAYRQGRALIMRIIICTVVLMLCTELITCATLLNEALAQPGFIFIISTFFIVSAIAFRLINHTYNKKNNNNEEEHVKKS